MLNTFEALAEFSDTEKNGASDTTAAQSDNNASVDLSAIINRLNEMETKINELVNKTTDFPARGNNDNSAIDNGNDDNSANDGGNNNDGE